MQKNVDYKRTLSKLHESHLLNEESTDKRFKLLSLFSGIGGMDLGFSASRFEIVGHVELNKDISQIYDLNFKKSKLLCHDITGLDINSLEEGMADVIVGGPPCQGFSMAGQRNIDDPRNKLYLYYLKVVDKVKPKLFIMENVKSLLSMKDEFGNKVIDNIRTSFSEIGYNIDYKVLNASHFGVPQIRQRIFIVGTPKDNKLFDFSTLERNNHHITTFEDACKDLKSIEHASTTDDFLHQTSTHKESLLVMMKVVKEGESAHTNEDLTLRPNSGYGCTYARMVWKKPAYTILTHFDNAGALRTWHPFCNRTITMREAARLQSFPNEFKYLEKKSAIKTGIGNAVPPLLAYNIACEIKKYLEQE